MAIHVRKIAKRSWILALRVMALLLIIVGIAVGLLVGTEAGRISLAHQAVKFYGVYSNDDIRIGGVESSSPGQWFVRSANWAPYASDLQVSVQELSLRWNWRFAFNNRWWLPELSIEKLDVTMPNNQTVSDSSESNIQTYANLWQKLPSFRLEQVLVNQLTINRTNYPSLKVSVNAQADINWGVVPARLIVSVSDHNSSNELALQLDAEGVDQFRAKGAIDAESGSSWAKWLNWSLDQNLTANWDLLADYSTGNQLTIDIGDSTLPWQKHQLNAKGRLVYFIEQQQFNFEQLVMHLDSQPAIINGWINQSESELDIAVDQWSLTPFMRYFGVPQSKGEVTGDLQWYGGWRTPRVNGQIDMQGSWYGIPVASTLVSEATSSGIRIEQADVTAGKNNIALQGEVDWRDDKISLVYQTNIKRGPFINRLLEKIPASIDFNGDLDGTVSGKVFEPVIEYSGKTQLTYLGKRYQAALSGRVSQKQLVVDEYALFGELAHFNGQGQYDFFSQQWQSDLTIVEVDSRLLDLISVQLPIEWHAVLSGKFAAKSSGNSFNVEGNASLQGLYEQEPMNAQLSVSQFNHQSIAFSRANLRIGDSYIQGKGSANWFEPKWDLDIEHENLNLALIQPWISQWPESLSSLAANFTGRTRLTNVWNQPIIQTTSDVSGQWYGQPLSVQLKVEPKSLNSWQLNIEKGRWYDSQFAYQGELDAYNLRLLGDLNIELWPLTSFIVFNKNVLGRSVEVPRELSGDFKAELAIDGSLEEYFLQGEAGFEGAFQNQPLDTQVKLSSLTPVKVIIDGLSSSWGTNRAELSGFYNFNDAQYQLTLDASMAQVEPLAELFAPFIVNETVRSSIQSWNGQLDTQLQAKHEQGVVHIDGQLKSQGQWFDSDYQIQWQGQGRLNELLNQTLNATWGDARLVANVDLIAEQLTGEVSVENLSLQQLKRVLPQVPVDLTGVIDTSLDVSGTLKEPSLALSGGGKGKWNSTVKEHRWNARIEGAWQKSRWVLSQGSLNVDGGGEVKVSAQGQGNEGEIRVKAEVPQTNYWVADTELGPGKANFDLTLQGDLRRPAIEMDAAWHAQIWPLALTSKIRTSEERLQVSGAVVSDGLNRIKMNANLPLRTWSDWNSNWHEIPFGFDIAIHSPLSVLDPFFVDRPNQSLSGLLAGQFSFNGSFDDPDWEGKVEWRDGKFENITSGTLLNDLDLTFLAQKSTLVLLGFANDGRDGLLEINGGVEFDPQPNEIFKHAFDVSFKAFNANMISDSQIDATMTGGVSVTGQYHDLLVSGSFDVSPLNLQTETFLLDGVPQLNIVDSIEEEEEVEAPRPIYWPAGRWDVGLTASNRANLYGQGISAELAGSLELLGEFSEPNISGRFNVIRGTYSALGKVFSVTGGSVQIQNNQLVFNVEANYNESGLNVLLMIAGTQDELTLELQSIPALDKNELLAQLVFGESIENISEFQAIQLAYLVNNIRTGTTSFDIIGSTRQELTLDSLIIDPQTDEEGNLGVNVRAGKYLNNYLYLEVEQNVGSEEGLRSSLQLQVTPNTYLELFAEESLGTGGAELKWSIDY
ncbi:translocation/assembly module TamB domain-containing protein [Reinekea marina]|uniref:Translocation/assembly module TamB domain-containing protein n=1 Tax=Reinekea marina TaxID=1310421 RepID=A0ABV7WQU5_9GAMM|nr:translocation/assembly module TamB domain-containing protein [Reinekea marina]MDN3648225.1 translocation/assembly module TamB domain-containing protein [Reinekea marina]